MLRQEKTGCILIKPIMNRDYCLNRRFTQISQIALTVSVPDFRFESGFGKFAHICGSISVSIMNAESQGIFFPDKSA